MRIGIVAAAFLVLGAIIGGVAARQEFAHDVLPIGDVQPTGGSSKDANSIGPRLTILSAESYDFGTMDENATMHHVFEIRNDGDAPLQITPQGTSCKCTVAGVIKDQLQPQETARITLEWTAKGVNDFFEQYADYSTNDTFRQKFRLSVTGRVHATLRAEPREAVFNRVSSQEPARATFKLFASGLNKLEVIKHEFKHAPSAPFFSLQFRPLEAAEIPENSEYPSGLEVQVDLKPGLPLGQLEQTIQITTNLNPDATFDIPVYGSIVSDISLVGPNSSVETMTVDLGSFPSRQGAKSTVYLVVKGPHRDETQLQIASVVPDTELSASLGEPIRNNPQIVSYPLILEVRPGATPVSRLSAGSRTAVRIETTHPQVKELTLYAKYAVVD